MKIPLEFYQSINLLNAVLSAIIGLFVLVTRKPSRQIIQFSLFAFFVALWDTFYFLAFQTNNFALSAFLFRTCMIAGALILPMFTEFVYTFVGKEIKSLYRWLNWGITALIISTIYTNLYAFDGGPFIVFHYWPIIGLMSFVQIILYGVNVFCSHRELLRMSISGDHLRQQQAKIMIVGTSLGYFGAFTNFLLWFRLPFPPIFNILIPIYVFSVAYAITKHRLMDIRVVISRTVAELLAIISLGSIYLGLVWVYQGFVSPQINWLFLALTIFYGLFVGEKYHELRLFFQTTSDKLFLRGKYDYYQALSGAGEQITKTLSMDNILQTLRQTFADVMEVANQRIYISEEEIRPFSECQTITQKENDLIIPCRLEGRLIAVIVLGKKLSEDSYTTEDLRLLKALASHAAVAIDHTRTYEQIKKDYEANQKKLYDTERLLARSEKIASLANMIREYNHEIKTPLTIIRNNIALLPDDPQLAEFKKTTVNAIRRADNIVESTLRLSEPKERQAVALNLNEVIEEALKLFPPSGVHLVKELNPLPALKGDKEDLQTVFVNLIKNAVEAMPQGGELKLKTYSVIKDDKPTICAEISDSGVGVPKENLEKIFEPFFSTHVTKGRGLGLSIVFRIIREHGGTLEVASSVGLGTTFKLFF